MDHWSLGRQHPDALADWRAEVENDDTRLGFADWLANNRQHHTQPTKADTNGYIDEPTHYRIFSEPTTNDDDVEVLQWTIDGADGERGIAIGNGTGFTQDAWSFDTFEQAVLALPAFAKLHPIVRQPAPEGHVFVLRRTPVFDLTVPDEAWVENEGLDSPANCLYATLNINGTPHHLEAWQVEWAGDEWDTNDPQYSDALRLLHTAVSGDGPFQTTTIRGQRYVLVATPYCN